MGQTRTVMVKRKDKTLVKCLLSLSEGVDSDGTRTFIACKSSNLRPITTLIKVEQ